ncbi:hypothetical protein GY45DRAFT_1318692 [Cubamyces sp. BRFM 1775]|nr:hypothetical protein GY45DRAFT_1318692 [Cubamyces sp. BRFM 1775]
MACPDNIWKDDELWFEDGNLIIVAGGVGFRVYEGPLLLHSEVIRNMVSMPAPNSSDAADDAVRKGPGIVLAWIPVHSVEFHDPPADVKYFLRTFTPGRQLRIGTVHPSFEEVSACIRLGDKYHCMELVEAYIDYLKLYYPAGLAAEPSSPNGQAERDPYRYPLTPPAFELKHTIGVVNIIRDMERNDLGREMGVTDMLPVALGRCMVLGAQVTMGFAYNDGRQEDLSREDLGRVLMGPRDFIRTYCQAVDRVFEPKLAANCPLLAHSRIPCPVVLKKLGCLLRELKVFVLDPTQLVYMWNEHLKQQGLGPNAIKLCDYCYFKFLVRAKEEQQKMFRRLPTILGLV